MKTANKSRFYVYKLIDPLTNDPFYVGKGTGNRYKDHETYCDIVYEKATHNNKLLKNKIRKVLKESSYIRYQVHYTASEEQAFIYEKALIKRYGRRDNKTGILCNMTDGGEGCSGHIRDDQWREKQRKLKLHKGKPIDQYAMDGTFVQSWESTRHVVDALSIDGSAINMCCNNKIKSAGGFRWTWKGQKLLEWKPTRKQHKLHKPHKPHKGKIVYQFTLEGEFINSYPSLMAAGEQINKHPNTILENCKGRTSHAGGFYWSYTPEAPPDIPHTIFQYDSNGTFVKSYISLLSATVQTKLTKSQIRNALDKPNRLGGGYMWTSSKCKHLPLHKKKTTGVVVYQYTTTGDLVNTFESCKQAINQTGIKGINNCINGFAKTAGGYIWKRS